MSDEEFLARWSRRKREAKAAVEAPPPTEPAETPDPAPSATAENPANAEVDLANLPPVESITAATDVTAFLRQGIPPELSRAALRRAWAADPAIRDFVGLAENAWRMHGTSTTRTPCPVSGHSIVQKNSLVRSLTGLSGACAAPLTALRPQSQSKRTQANRLIQTMNRYWNRAPQRRSPIKVLRRKFRWASRQQLLLRCNRKLLRAMGAIKPRPGVAPMEAPCPASLSTKDYSLRLCRSIDRSPTEV